MRLILTPALCLRASSAREWRTSRRSSDRALRPALGAQLGLRRLHDLREVVDWVAREARASFVALNPLHAIHNRRPFNTSPYLPNSIFYQNFLYLDLDSIEDFAVPCAQPGCGTARKRRTKIEALRSSEFVEYERVARLKLCFLKLAFLAFRREIRAGSPRARQFQHSWSARANCWNASPSTAPWMNTCTAPSGPVGCGRDGPSLTATRTRAETRQFRRKHWRAVHVLPVRAVAARSPAGCGAAVRTASAGWPSAFTTTWRWPPTAAVRTFGRTAPFMSPAAAWDRRPTISRPKGRTGPFRRRAREHHCETGYRLFAESIRKNCRHGGALRIDHVMRFFRLYWIPEEPGRHRRAPTCGTAAEDLIRILALESVRNQVVGDWVRIWERWTVGARDLARFGILSYRLFYFEKTRGRRVQAPTTSTRRRRWSLPPRTTCPRWRVFG